MRSRLLTLAVATVVATSASSAQESPGGVTTRSPISIGNYSSVDGLRLNFRDRDLQRVRGVNVTVWSPYEPVRGTITGWAIGLPLAGAENIDGLATGLAGVSASHRIRGLTLSPIGAGTGSGISGIAIAGVGLGSGGNLEGLMVGGVGAGAGGNLKGIIVGGVGAGAGGDIKGLILAGVGSGAGGTITGLAVGGVGLGAGMSIRGVALAGVGVGAPRLDGIFAALGIGASHARGLVVAPALFKVAAGGSFEGVALSGVNHLRGSQTGLSVGIFNYARSLNGVQLGVINVVADAKDHPILPLVNWGSRRE
jgi:hypothetical protein